MEIKVIQHPDVDLIIKGILERFDKKFKWFSDHSEYLDEESYQDMKDFIWFEIRQLLIKNGGDRK